jgi:hypothetical protein
MKIRTAQAYMKLAEIPEDEWQEKKDQTIQEVLWSAGRKPKQPKPEPKQDDDPTNGPEWADPEHPEAELYEVQGGVAEEPEREEWNSMREAKRWLEAAIRQAYKLVGRKAVEHIVKELLDELDGSDGTVH